MTNFASFIESIRDYRPDLFEYLENAPDDVLVHFTKHDSVNIKVKPAHLDPIGVYAFPKRYILSPEFNKNSYFAGMKNVFIIRMKPGLNILNLSRITEKEVDEIIEKLGMGQYKVKGDKPGKTLWETIEKYLETKPHKNIDWNKIFKQIGNIDVLVDEGDAIIHSNEPIQTVILKPGGFTELEKFTLTTSKSYKFLAMKIVSTVSQLVFDNYRVTSRRRNDEITITSNGTKNGKEFHLSFSYYQNLRDQGVHSLQYPLRGKFFIQGKLRNNYLSDLYITIPFSEEDADEDNKITVISQKISKYINEEDNLEDLSSLTKELTKRITEKLGFGKTPTGDYYKKFYPGYGLFTINVHLSHYNSDTYQVSFILKGETNLYGPQDKTLPVEYVKNNLDKAAHWFIQINLDYWEEMIRKLYKNNPSDWYGYEKAKTGEKLLKFVEFLRSKFNRRSQS